MFFRLFQKILSAGLMFFILQSSLEPEVFANSSFMGGKFPEQWGRVEETWKGDSNSAPVYFIQDALFHKPEGKVMQLSRMEVRWRMFAEKVWDFMVYRAFVVSA